MDQAKLQNEKMELSNETIGNIGGGISESQAAKRIGIGLSSLRRHRREGTAPKHAMVGRRPIYTPMWCDEWLASRVVR